MPSCSFDDAREEELDQTLGREADQPRVHQHQPSIGRAFEPIARLDAATTFGDAAPEGLQLAFCQRNTEAAKRDLVRICAEIREELAPEELPLSATLPAGGAGEAPESGIAGAVYVSCSGRGGPHFGAPSAELQIVRRALGDVPLAGFFAGGEIARHHVYGYTGVLTVFRA